MSAERRPGGWIPDDYLRTNVIAGCQFSTVGWRMMSKTRRRAHGPSTGTAAMCNGWPPKSTITQEARARAEPRRRPKVHDVEARLRSFSMLLTLFSRTLSLSSYCISFSPREFRKDVNICFGLRTYFTRLKLGPLPLRPPVCHVVKLWYYGYRGARGSSKRIQSR